MAKSRNSFNGTIENIPDIFVDNFKDTNKKAYFLSHCHTDHTDGLYSQTLIRNLKKNYAKIYMTEESMKIIRYEAGKKSIYDICEFIVPLGLCTTTLTIGDSHIEVTLIPAGHCLGSVMFLFRINKKTILYTGDFTMRVNDISKYAQLHKNDEPIHIDVMYVDTTFISSRHPEFPKRSDSVEEIMKKIDGWLNEDPNNRVALHTSAFCGYEYLLNKIYKKLGYKVNVDDDKWRMYEDFPNIITGLTRNETDPKIHLCKNIKMKLKCHHNYLRSNNYLSIQFSAMSWENYDDEQTTMRDGYDNTIQVCYATHCSRREIINFVSYFEPEKVFGFPNQYSIESPSEFDDCFEPSSKKTKYDVLKERINMDASKKLF